MRTNEGCGSMFDKEDVMISGQLFSSSVFHYLLARFKEAFSHSSLTIEEAFQDLENFDLIINTTMDNTAFKYYSCLTTKEKKEITDVLHQIIVFKGSRYGVFSEQLTGDPKQFEALYHKYFSFFDSYIHYYIAFDQEGNFDKSETFRKIDPLFMNLPQRTAAYKKAYGMKKDHMDAFDFAVSKDKLSISDTIQINNIVNDSDEDKVLGFKKTNNFIMGASFQTTDKMDVPFEMQKLYAEYEREFDSPTLDPNEPGISGKEKYNRTCEILRKEALFHIRFVRIHPFNDGNGRTARILLNQHLLRQGLAPVIISDVMSDEYKQCINNNDVEGLAKILFYSLSLQIANWVSLKKAHPKLHKRDLSVSNSELAELLDFDENGDSGEKNKLFGKGSFLF